jgi:lysylphosphatidylglycerol synthetase-like protein (DUF2156 family)
MFTDRHTLLTQAQRRIDRAWFAALVASCLSLILAAFSGRAMEEFGLSERITALDAVFVLMLAYGVLKRSRVAAALLLIHLLLVRGLVLFLSPSLLATPVVLLFAYIYADGLRGTIHYHRLTRLAGEQTAAADGRPK